jgi:RNA polymerase sigma factor (sigma-70 family)
MTARRLCTLIQHLRRAAGPPGGGAPTDADLLARWATHRDEAAFELLLWRHGPLVWAACRRLLGDVPDAEDAFQATFLVLLRKAGSVRAGGALGAWLHRVACRVALRLRAARARRAGRERAVRDVPAPAAADAVAGRELGAALDEEIDRLPRRQRRAFVLCCLEGKTQAEAARLLGCPPGTLSAWVARAREKLRARLAGRGLALPAALAGVALAEGVAPAGVPAALVGATAQAGLAGAAPARVAELASGVARAMSVTRWKVVTAVVLALGFVGGSAALLSRPAAGARPPAPAPQGAPAVSGVMRRPGEGRFGDWGDLRGRFVFDGKAPAPKPLDLSRSPDREHFAGLGLHEESLLVDKGGGLANVLVWALDTGGKAHPDYAKDAKAKVRLTARGGRFEPRILPLRTTQTLVLTNAERVAMNFAYGTPRGEIPFNFLLRPGEEREVRLSVPQTAVGRVVCNIHPWMRGYLLPRESPYAAVSGTDGSFVLAKLPVGEWEFRAWHEQGGWPKVPGWDKGRFKVRIKPGKNDLGTIKLAPAQFAP